MMSSLTIRGAVSVEGGEFPVAGVTVIAQMPAGMVPDTKQSYQGVHIQLGRAVTDSDGRFEIETDEHDSLTARAACVLRTCGNLKFTVGAFDGDELLRETEPLAYADEVPAEIELREPDYAPNSEDWAALARRMRESQTVQLGDVAAELATLAPKRLFADWSVARRLGVLRQLEQALLDPTNVFGESGIALRFSHLTSDDDVSSLRERFRRDDRVDLLEALDGSVERARKIGGWREVDLTGEPDRIGRGEYRAGVNYFVDKPSLLPGLFPWSNSPTVGYRDYLRDRWMDNQKFQHVLGGTPQQVSTPATLIQRLNHRFHQDFATTDDAEQPANRVLIPILLRMIAAPTGSGYGFNVAAATIEPQGTRADRDYLDYLISLAPVKLDELEKRYRLNLQRSDFEMSSPVQQNIDTLQRFFTDSYQSVEDPLAIKPDRKAGTDERLIIKFPPEGAGPFFLEYEEWLAREEPFYPEDHYDPRATYYFATDEHAAQKTRDVVFGKSMPLGEAVEQSLGAVRFVPGRGAYDHVAGKWQWVRNHLELQDLINAANNDAKSLNYVAAEQKYALALVWAEKLRRLISFAPAGWWDYDPAATAKWQKKADVSDMAKLVTYERQYHLYLGWHYGIVPEYGDILAGNTEISAKWWGDRQDLFPGPGHRATVAYLIDHLCFKLLPACLSEMQLAQGKYAGAVRQLIEPASFNIFAAAPALDVFTGFTVAGMLRHATDGPLPYASTSDRSTIPPKVPPTKAATNRAELGYFKLKLGNATLEWADVLYRSNQPENIMRARELYKAVLFLHGEDPEITPSWERRRELMPVFPGKKSKRNPAIAGQVNRARLGFMQINAGLNYYAMSPAHVPPVRYRVLKEAADRFAAGARGAQSDFLNYMQQLDQITVSEMTARTMVAKANSAISIAQEQQKIAEFHVGEVQKQVDAINAQIAAKRAEITKADDFFEQAKDFAGGMKDSVSKLGDIAFAGEGASEAASAQTLSSGDVMSLAMKFGGSGGNMSAATGALGSSMAVAGPFAAFLYAGVSSISGMAEAAGKRLGELKALENALPAAKALVELKKREVTIAKLAQDIAKADWQLGKDLLAFYASRFLNRSFLVNLSEFSNRLMRRYLDLAGRMAWSAERALSFEQDRQIGVITFDYFPRNLRGVTGADLLQLHLAELEAARIQGLTQTIPVKQTFSLTRDFPVQFGQLKKTGICRFSTLEAPLRLVHPGVYGYRVRNVTVAATYADPVQPHRGMLTNHGVSLVTRDQPGVGHTLIRYPDALPLSEFRMRDDMWVFDLPDETLLPFEGSGIETVWQLMLSKVGNANGFGSLTDMLITFDMRASYSAALEKQHIAALPNTAVRSLLVSAKTMNPGAIRDFRDNGGQLTLEFDLGRLARNTNETARKILNFVIVAVGVGDVPFSATFSSDNPAQDKVITLENGLALSNSGALAGGNAGVPLPLNAFVGLDIDQVFTLVIDGASNPTTDFTNVSEVLLLAEYEATF
jgi:hypothetical protein